MNTQNNTVVKAIDKDRKNGFRPVIVACIIKAKKILFVFKRNFNLWQLPQGGIEVGEDFLFAAKRELFEELGSFSEKIDFSTLEIIGHDIIEFPIENQGTREVITETGEKIHMLGKKYYFAKIKAENFDLPIEESEFEKYRWVSRKETNNLVRHIYQKGKKRVTKHALKILEEKNLI